MNSSFLFLLTIFLKIVRSFFFKYKIHHRLLVERIKIGNRMGGIHLSNFSSS